MRTLLVCLALFPLLAACGQGETPAPKTPASAPVVAAPAPAIPAPAPGETKTVTLAIEGMG
jgi:hypothetical protein